MVGDAHIWWRSEDCVMSMELHYDTAAGMAGVAPASNRWIDSALTMLITTCAILFVSCASVALALA